LNALLVSHSHFDHSMDGEGCRIGKFQITFYESKHFPLSIRKRKLLNRKLDKPLKLPAKVLDYPDGKMYSIHIKHPKGKVLVHASAGFIEDASLENIDDSTDKKHVRKNKIETLTSDAEADVVFLGIGMPFLRGRGYVRRYWNGVVEKVNPKKIFPIHWDSPVRPITTTTRTTPLFVDHVTETLKQLKTYATAENKKLELLPINKTIKLF